MTITARVDAITRIDPDRLAVAPPVPKSVKIEISSRCNFACVFCARSMKLRDQKDMDRGLFERLLMEMRAAGVEEIGIFYLGESFLCEWLPEAIRFAKHEAGFSYVFLTTNGSLAMPKRVESCIRAGLDSLKFSLNYADEAQFVEIARVKPKLYRQMIANVRASRAVRDSVEAATGHHCGLYGSYIEYDGAQAAAMETMVADLRGSLDEVYALPLYSQADLVGDSERARGWAVTAGNRGRADALRDPLPCWSLFTEGHITSSGKLVGCCFSHHGFVMADLTKVSFTDGWNSDKFQSLRRANIAKDVRGTECDRCVAYR